MGFLKVFGRPLDFEDSKQYIEKIRKGAVDTLIDWMSSTMCKVCCPKFGYEVEIHLINIDHDKKTVQVDLTGEDLIRQVCEKEEYIKDIMDGKDDSESGFILQYEYGRWMIECVPKHPFAFCEMQDFENSMIELYSFFDNLLGKNKVLFISSFPLLGAKNKEYPYYHLPEIIEAAHSSSFTSNSSSEHEEFKLEDTKDNPFSKSDYIDDVIINTHPRFGTLSRNIRTRRGSKVDIRIPIYKDINTLSSNLDEPFPGFIHMDAMAFGMGSCCLQMTVGTCSLNSTCYLYDQFIPLTPILLALSSSSPIYKGKLSAYDNRFSVISQSVDDRTEEERNPLSSNYIYKSRYSPCYSYISDNVYIQDFHNDYPKFPINEEYLKTITNSGVHQRLATHFCNLLVRDPLVIFEKKIDITDKTDRSHFENFNSTNWNSLRFKPPRAEDNDSCFKIEVRPCDLQLTPFENTSILSLVLCLYASVFTYDANFIIPISLVDENFERAYQMDAIEKQKFYWRVNGIDNSLKNINASLRDNKFLKPHDNVPSSLFNKEEDMKNIKELTIKEIFFGSEEYNYPGILMICDKAIDEKIKGENVRAYLKTFLEFISKRASGELWTDAKYIRNFVLEHPKYNKDSIVTDEINYDLINHLLQIQNREIHPEVLLGHYCDCKK